MKTKYLIVLLGLVAACDASTTGKRVALKTRLRTDPAAATTFLSQTGWNITLERALISTGPFYYFEGEPAFVERRTKPLWRHFAGLFIEGTAHAHPGHYVSGGARGEMLAAFSADLMQVETAFPDGDGISGLFRSARFSFAQPSAGPAVGDLAGHIALVEGKAEKGGRTVHFRMAADFDDVAKSVTDAQVEGCIFEEADVEEDGTITITVRPSVWFSFVDFGGVADGAEDNPTVVTSAETPGIAFALGLAQLTAYRFSYAHE